MDLKESDRLRSRVLAIDLRLAELDQELRRTQVRVNHLEAELENARLAGLLGDSAGNPDELGPELEKSRGRLESQQELIEQVKQSLWKARVAYTLTQATERRTERESQEQEEQAS